MTRFDVLAPHKAALKSIHASGPADFALAGPFLSSQHWMLQAAGIATDGTTGALRVAGLGVTYASVFRTWLEDDDPGLARTMAALDRRLRRGERTLGGIEGVASALNRFATDAPGLPALGPARPPQARCRRRPRSRHAVAHRTFRHRLSASSAALTGSAVAVPSTNAAVTPTSASVAPTVKKNATNASSDSARPRSMCRTASRPHRRCVNEPITVTIAG